MLGKVTVALKMIVTLPSWILAEGSVLEITLKDEFWGIMGVPAFKTLENLILGGGPPIGKGGW